MTNFIELGLPKPTAVGLKGIGFTQPTEIQAKAIPVIISGQDIMASAQTGSGKTAAYALPLIELLRRKKVLEAQRKASKEVIPGTKASILVLVPTRELAIQVAQEFERFCGYLTNRVALIYGGSSYDKQMKAIKKGVEVIVATPGRLLDHVQRRTIDLSGIEQLILDEADRLMDMGFMPQVRRVVSKLPTNRQTLMFSATIDRRIEQIGSEFLRAPSVVRSSSPRIEPVEIEQRMYHVDEFGKDELLAQVLKENDTNSVLVFTQTRRKAAWVRARLRDSNVHAEEIHSDITQSQREKTLSRYRDGHFAVLVATDVASRGLDIPAIGLVVNYDLPNSAEDYVHRIGRTGRAGRSGVAISFVSSEQKHLIKDIETLTGRRLDMTAEHRSTQPFSRKPIAGRRFRPARRSRAV